MAGGNVPGNLAPIFQSAGAQYHIDPSVLAGIASVESNFGANQGPSSAGAVGVMQFEPGTARSIGINPLNAQQAIYGAARLLNQYGYQQNPTRAIGAYNGGPGNPQFGYAQQVLSEASRVKGQLGGGGSSLPAVQSGTGQTVQVQVPSFNQAGFKQAQARYLLGELQKGTPNPFDATDAKGQNGFGGGGNPLLSTGLLTTKAPNPADYQTSVTKTYQLAQNSLQELAGSTGLNVHPAATSNGQYVNPLGKAEGIVPERVDQGKDYSMHPGSPILAIGDSKVLQIQPNWYQGQPYMALELLNGPQKGEVYYVAEQIVPTVRPGDVVHAGQQIASYASNGTGIETGWASKDGSRTLAQATTGYTEGQATHAGQNFESFLSSLGAPV